MRVAVIGLGVQGRKRVLAAGSDVAITVDATVPDAQYSSIEQVQLTDFDIAIVSTPDGVKLGLIYYLLSNDKHVMVEKPLFASDQQDLERLAALAESRGVTCYTAYNHRFEPHIRKVKEAL